MTTVTTPNLALVKAVPNTGEPFDGAVFLWPNFDAIDAAAGKRTTKTSSTVVASSTTETVLFKHTITANTAIAGAAYRMVAIGTAGNVVTAVPTLTLRARIGGVAGDLLATCVITAPVTAQSGRSFRAEADLWCFTIGVSGNWLGSLQVINTLGAPGTLGAADVDAPAGATPQDTTTDQDWVLTAQWSASNAANTVSCTAAYAGRAA